MRKTIICDTSCFIVLSKINEFDLLHQVYGQITTTQEVAAEFGQTFPDWIVIEQPTNSRIQEILEIQLDKGESSAIALALEIKDCTLVIDDIKARRAAEKLNLKITGTVGVIVKAKINGIIPSIKPLLEKIKSTNFRLTDEIERQALIAANERYSRLAPAPNTGLYAIGADSTTIISFSKASAFVPAVG